MSAWNEQVGGDWYTRMAIQPNQYALANDLFSLEKDVIKYVSRWKNKDGLKDLNKALHVCRLMLEYWTVGEGVNRMLHPHHIRITPAEYAKANGLGLYEAVVVKHVTMWRNGGGVGALALAEKTIRLLIRNAELQARGVKVSLAGAQVAAAGQSD